MNDVFLFNLGESQTVELRELIKLLEKNFGRKATIERKPMQPGDVPQTFADISKARKLLNYNPQTNIEKGIAKFVEWFVEQNRDTKFERRNAEFEIQESRFEM